MFFAFLGKEWDKMGSYPVTDPRVSQTKELLIDKLVVLTPSRLMVMMNSIPVSFIFFQQCYVHFSVEKPCCRWRLRSGVCIDTKLFCIGEAGMMYPLWLPASPLPWLQPLYVLFCESHSILINQSQGDHCTLSSQMVRAEVIPRSGVWGCICLCLLLWKRPR